MERTRKKSATPRPVLYAGRLAARVRQDDLLPADCLLLDDWGALPGPLADAAENAPAILVADPLSFPFEALVGEAQDVPLVLALPAGRDAAFLSAVFGETVLANLGFFDRVATNDDALWETLRRRYGWAESRRVTADPEDPAELVAGALEQIGPDDRREKAVQRVRGAALLPRFAAARGLDRSPDAGGVPLDVLHVGSGDGRWFGGFDPAATRFSGVDRDEEAVAAAGRDFPEGRFAALGPDARIPHDDERFDLVFSTGELGRRAGEGKEAAISEMWRVARPGGRLLFLEDFVTGGEAPHVVSINEFVAALTRATGGQVVLEYVRSVRYPGEDVVRGGVIGVSRLGVPRRW